MHNSDTFTVVILSIFGAVVVGAIVFALVRAGRRSWHRFTLITTTPTMPTSRLRPGLVEVQGKATTDMDLLKSPMTRQRCIYYRFKVTEQRSEWRNGKRRTKRVTVVDDVRCIACYVDDGSGRVRVELESAELYLKTDARRSSGFLNDVPADLQDTLSRQYGTSTTGLVFNKTMTFEETCVAPGDKLYVLGTADRRGEGFVIGGNGYDMKGADPFLVSDHPERELARQIKNKAIGAFAGAAVVVVGVSGVVGWLLLR